MIVKNIHLQETEGVREVFDYFTQKYQCENIMPNWSGF